MGSRVRVPYAPQQRKKDSQKEPFFFLLPHPLTMETHLGRYAFVANTKIQNAKLQKRKIKPLPLWYTIHYIAHGFAKPLQVLCKKGKMRGFEEVATMTFGLFSSRHAEFSSASHREPLPVPLRGQILKFAVKWEQSQACLCYAERQQIEQG